MNLGTVSYPNTLVFMQNLEEMVKDEFTNALSKSGLLRLKSKFGTLVIGLIFM